MPTGNVPTTSERSTILVPTKVRLIAEVWGYIVNILENIDHVYNGRYHTVQQLVLMYHTTSFLLLETVSTHSLFSVVLNNTVSQYVAESFDAHTHTIFLNVYALKQQPRHEAGQLSTQFVCLLGRFKQDLAWSHHTSWNYRYRIQISIMIYTGGSERSLWEHVGLLNNNKQKLSGITDSQSGIEYMFVISTVLVDGFERKVQWKFNGMAWYNTINITHLDYSHEYHCVILLRTT